MKKTVHDTTIQENLKQNKTKTIERNDKFRNNRPSSKENIKE